MKKDSDTNKMFFFMKNNKEEIPIMLTDKIPKVTKEKQIFVEKFFPNEKADKLLMMYRKNEKFNF